MEEIGTTSAKSQEKIRRQRGGTTREMRKDKARRRGIWGKSPRSWGWRTTRGPISGRGAMELQAERIEPGMGQP